MLKSVIDEFRYSDSYSGTDKLDLMFHETCETLDKMEAVNGAVQSGISLYSRRITDAEIPRDLAVKIDASDTLSYQLTPGLKFSSDTGIGTIDEPLLGYAVWRNL